MTIFLSHAADARAHYYGEEALARLRQLGEVRLNEIGRPLATPELIEQAAGCAVIVSDRQTEGPAECGPLPALEAITAQAPTAELRPPAATQTDEADLMPYPLLDAIERAAIRDKQMPLEVYQLMRLQFPKYESPQLAVWVERFFRLWCRNQWKRERYAPSFHVDDENLDPKTWCRFPILSGGFERELAELRAHVKEKSGGG